MKKPIMDYDPLAPTPHRKDRSDDAAPESRQHETPTLTETANAELALKKNKDEDLKKRHAEAQDRWQAERQKTEWSYGWETEKLRIRGKTLDQEFERSSKDNAVRKPAEPKAEQDKTVGWQASARAQVEVSREREYALDRHDVRWQIREQQLGLQSAPQPAPPGEMSDDLQSHKERFVEARGLWEVQQDEINEKFDRQREDQRAKGVTLTDIHRESVEPMAHASPAPVEQDNIPSQPDHIDMDVGGPSPEQDEMLLDDDFTVASGNMSKGRDM